MGLPVLLSGKSHVNWDKLVTLSFCVGPIQTDSPYLVSDMAASSSSYVVLTVGTPGGQESLFPASSSNKFRGDLRFALLGPNCSP